MDERPGEQVFFHGHPSWRSMLAFYIKGLAVTIAVGAVVGVVSAIANGGVRASWVAPAVAIVLVAVLVIGFVRQVRTTYTITDQRLTIHRGLVSRDMHETRLERVQNVNVSQSILQRLLRVGTVDFDTAGSADFDFAFRGVAGPKEIALTVDRALHELQRMNPSGVQSP
jgi:uncharacterized membrane protein YdbT with pleckstrin-like domain